MVPFVGRTFLLGAVVFCSLFWSRLAWCDDLTVPTFPFEPGERLTFILKWTVIPAGEAVLEVMPREKINGINANRFLLTAKSNEFVDAIYKVRDRIDAWTDLSLSRSLLYQKKQQEGRTRRDITVTFDWDKKVAYYANKGKTMDPISIADGTFDPLSIFYWFRSTTWKIGGRVERTVTDGKKNVVGVAHIIRKERIKVPAGVFDTILVEPDISHVGGVFEKSPRARIQVWISADSRRIPIRLKSKVVVGSFSGELASMKGVDPIVPINVTHGEVNE
jgi:hypothetical protein